MEWLVEDGIGERRAGLLDGGRLIEMALEWDDDPAPRCGAIVPARLVAGADATGRGRARLDTGEVVLLRPVPFGLTQGGALLVEITREALPEGGALKPAHARPAHGEAPRGGPDLLSRLHARSAPVRRVSGGETLEASGWSEAIEEAASGLVTRPDLLLRISPTPAMTLIDVDGSAAPAELAIAGAREAAAAMRRFDIAGSIGIDLPTLTSKAERQAAAAALDTLLPQPFERTGINGFGFLQVVRRRERRSLVERLRADPVGAAARALLRQATRASGAGELRLVAHPRVIARIEAGPGWVEAVAREAGAAVALRAEAAVAISGGYAARAIP